MRIQYGKEPLDRAVLWAGLLTDEFGGEVVMSLPLHQECVKLTDAALQAVGFAARPSWAVIGGWP